MEEDFSYNINEAYNTLYILPYGKLLYLYAIMDDLYENINNILINCSNNMYIYSGYNWNIDNNVISLLNNPNELYPIYIYTNYTDILPYDNTKIIIRIPYNYFQFNIPIRNLIIYEMFEALLYMGYYGKIYNSPDLNTKLEYILSNIKFIYEQQYNIINQLKTVPKCNNLRELVSSNYIANIIHIKDIFYSKWMLTHIFYNKCINVNDISIILYMYSYIGYNNGKGINTLVFKDTINNKIYDYISQIGKALLIDWELYGCIPYILLCFDDC